MFSNILAVLVVIIGIANLLLTANNCRKRYDAVRRDLDRRVHSVRFFQDNFPVRLADVVGGRRKATDRVNWKKEGF